MGSDYYHARAARHRLLAEAAQHSAARLAHIQLAEAYLARAAEGSADGTGADAPPTRERG